MSGIRKEKVNNIAILKIDRPEAYNSLSREIVEEMDRYAEELKSDKSIRVLILHSDHNFAAGADITGMAECNEKEAIEFAFSSTFNKLSSLEIPTIAAIEGYALGGGLELALTCDLRIASCKAKLGFPEITLGIMPGAGGTIRTPRLIGMAKAKELIYFGKTISGEEAKEIGLVNLVVEEDKVFEVAMQWAERLAELPQIALAVAKRTMDQGIQEQNLETAITNEMINWAKLFGTDDQKEGMRAFLEKRKPIYTGK